MTTTSEIAFTQSESIENSLDTREKPTSMLPSSGPAELPSTSTSTQTSEPIVSNDSYETPALTSHEGSPDTSHDDNEISNDVYLGTEAPAIPPASDSQLKNTSHPTPLSSNAGSAAQPADSITEKVSIDDDLAHVTTESVNNNEGYTTTDGASSLSQQEYTQSVTHSQSSTEYPSETTTPNKDTSESNEIAASPEYEKESVTTPEAVPAASDSPDVPITSLPAAETTVQSNSVSEETSTSISTPSSSEYYEIKTTTNEPYQNLQGEVTSSPSAEPSHDIYSTSSESSTAIVDDSDSIITAPPEPAPNSSEQTEGSSGIYQTTIKPESENPPVETTTSGSYDHSEDAGLQTTIVNEYSTDVPSEEPSTASSAIENKFQEKFSTSAPPSETEAYQSVATGSATPASASSNLSSESPAGGAETTVYTEEEVTTKQSEQSSYSSTSQSDVASSTLIYYSTTSPSQAATTEHEVTEINTQPALVAGSSETTPAPEYADIKTTLASALPDGSADSITTAVPTSEAGSVQSSEQSASPVATTTSTEKDVPTTLPASQSSFWSNVSEKVATLLNQTTTESPSSTSVTYPPIQHSTWTRKPVNEEVTSEPNYYPQPPMYPPGIENGNVDGPPVEEYDEENGAFGPGTCRYAGKVYVSAQQIPRDDPCDFCFCFRSDIICLQQSCPPPIHGCRQEPIEGFCCPRYECPVNTYGLHNTTTTTTTTTSSSRPPRSPAARRTGCMIYGHLYDVGESIPIASGPCLECL